MLKKAALLLGAALILVSGNPVSGSTEIDQALLENIDLSTLQFERIAIMPFLVGKLESPDNPVEKPLSLPLQQLNRSAANLVEGADQIITRLVHEVLKIRYKEQLVSQEEATAAYADASGNPTLDTPRKLSIKFGKNLRADLVIVGAIWRFREKGSMAEMPDNPASVAFSVYLVEIPSGKRLWRDAFDGTQKILSEDVLGGLTQVKMGFRWLSVTELARYGVQHVFRNFPLP